MAPVMISNDVVEILLDGKTMDTSNKGTLQLPGLSKRARQIHIFKKMKEALLISLGVLCDYG